MSAMDLPQDVADELMAMDKLRIDSTAHAYPSLGGRVSIPLRSADRRETFSLDLSRGRIDLTKTTLQNRARNVVIIARVDISGPPHRNPDGVAVPCPHLHRYREGYGDRWAEPLPKEFFSNPNDHTTLLYDFLAFCHVSEPPSITLGLFT